jgi:hypothetical protein
MEAAQHAQEERDIMRPGHTGQMTIYQFMDKVCRPELAAARAAAAAAAAAAVAAAAEAEAAAGGEGEAEGGDGDA